jgi:hypothetical protein
VFGISRRFFTFLGGRAITKVSKEMTGMLIVLFYFHKRNKISDKKDLIRSSSGLSKEKLRYQRRIHILAHI